MFVLERLWLLLFSSWLWRSMEGRKHESCVVVAGFTNRVRWWRVQWRHGTFQHGQSDVVEWGPRRTLSNVYSACECGGYVIPKFSRVGPIATRLTGPRPRASRVTQHNLTFDSIQINSKQKVLLYYINTFFILFFIFFVLLDKFECAIFLLVDLRKILYNNYEKWLSLFIWHWIII